MDKIIIANILSFIDDIEVVPKYILHHFYLV